MKRASIKVFPSHQLNAIDRLIYSGFLEHMGRCIYGGIYDPENPNQDLLSSREDGFRSDVISTLAPLEIPVFRYPGGNFTATYHWQDGVGPKSTRPKRLNIAWGNSIDTNTFGTDEFMSWLRSPLWQDSHSTEEQPSFNPQPYLCLNMGTGTLDEALAWLEYCNTTVDSHYANLRRLNTKHISTVHGKPHDVKYWALGNEIWGPWQVAQTTDPVIYAEQALQWAKALKLLDPGIKLILCGKDGISSWDYAVLKHCIVPATENDLGVKQPPLIDYISIHMYTASDVYEENVFAPLAAERAIQVVSSLIDLVAVENGLPASQPRPKIAFDEWNVWDPRRAVGSKGAEERYTLADALAVAVWLNVFVRQSERVGMACIAQSVNVISPLMTTQTGLVKQSSWWVYELFCRFVRGHQIQTVVDCEQYTGTTKPEWLGGCDGIKMKWLDVSACVDTDDKTGPWCCVCVVNLHKDQDITTDLSLGKVAGEIQVFTVNGDNIDDTNIDGEEKVTLKESKSKQGDAYTFPKHSFTLLRWKMSGLHAVQ